MSKQRKTKAQERQAKADEILETLREHAATKTEAKTEYELLADRVLAAVYELNAALQEAHKRVDMRVFLAMRERTAESAMQFEPQVYQLTHSSFGVTVKFMQDQGQWKVVKDPAYEHVAGDGPSYVWRQK